MAQSIHATQALGLESDFLILFKLLVVCSVCRLWLNITFATRLVFVQPTSTSHFTGNLESGNTEHNIEHCDRD